MPNSRGDKFAGSIVDGTKFMFKGFLANQPYLNVLILSVITIFVLEYKMIVVTEEILKASWIVLTACLLLNCVKALWHHKAKTHWVTLDVATLILMIILLSGAIWISHKPNWFQAIIHIEFSKAVMSRQLIYNAINSELYRNVLILSTTELCIKLTYFYHTRWKQQLRDFFTKKKVGVHRFKTR